MDYTFIDLISQEFVSNGGEGHMAKKLFYFALEWREIKQ